LLQITPQYLVALGLIIYAGYVFRILPAGGPYARHLQPEWSWEFISSLIQHAILPMLSNMIVIGAGFTLGMRALMISVLGEDYLTFARAKGLSPFTVLKDYAFRNALIPQVTGLAIILGATLNGAFIIEVLFQYPGLGTLFVQAMGLRDFNTMQAIVLFSIFAVLTLTLIVDLALPWFDPRIRRTA
jgi:peptide/nickel transport system permease protein